MGEIQNVTKKEFISAMHGLGACGEVGILVGLMKNPFRPDTKETIERAIRLAMKVSERADWEYLGLNAASRIEVQWTGAAPIKCVLRSKCSDATKGIARKILEITPEGIMFDDHRPHLSEAQYREKEKHELKKSQHITAITSYLGKELRGAGKDVLSRGTVKPPKGKAVAHCAGKGINTLKAQ